MPRPDPAALRPIRVRGLDDTLAAAAAADRLGVPLVLMADWAGGPLWLLGLLDRARRAHPGLEATALIDCGDRAGEAQGALAAGVPLLLFTGRADVAVRLAAIATARGAALLTRCPPPLDLAAPSLTESGGRRRRDALEALCRDWLSRPQG
ncbi:hypothetical protein [Azospirillum sp. TSO35-2]|uniref:hypothetical protein n=1 Tax=Azospirillum sp. TSO35-2 TaxID=716796 RepID=UPI000D61A012|nr:hypothetical protein [Azospirillum sp. TSO35-2]PWC33642.1 hypothetical protein TSO352_24850 [Azospirillum sp. TSO35-2]